MSLRDRLTRRSGTAETTKTPADNNGNTPPGPVPAVTASPRQTPVSKAPAAASSSGMYGRRTEVEQLSPLDQVKIDLHRKLIERLDLEALEQIPDERLLNS